MYKLVVVSLGIWGQPGGSPQIPKDSAPMRAKTKKIEHQVLRGENKHDIKSIIIKTTQRKNARKA